MKAIIYISQTHTEFDEKQLNDLANKAAVQNAEQGITGYLWFKKSQFVQYIEGNPDKLATLMLRIESDARHEILHKIEETKDIERRFPSWSMRYFSKQMAYEIGMETILTDQLLLLNTAYKNHVKSSDSLWRIVETISKQLHRKSL